MAKRREGVIVLIGVFKLVKAALLLTIGVTALVAMPHHVAHALARAFGWLGILSGRHAVEHLLERISALDRSIEHRLGIVSLCYAAVFTVEGLGLVRKKRWAEWMTVIVTASFVPFEVYELSAHFSAGKVIAVVLNATIVVYLVRVRLEERRLTAEAIRHALRAG
jgi:uncharacterized membrane protein (DUF2068 family)